jgi:acid phosphatase type 7
MNVRYDYISLQKIWAANHLVHLNKNSIWLLLFMQERVYNGRLDPCGAVHITIGDGGNREGLARRYHSSIRTRLWNLVHQLSQKFPASRHFRYRNPKPAWSVFRESSFGHGELKILNSTHAHWTWHRNDDEEPVRTDDVWINSLAGSGCIQDSSRELRKILMAP